MKIGVIGIGKLGLSFALLAESKGITVWGSDVSESYIKKIQTKQLKSNEPFINEFLENSKKLYVTTSNEKIIEECDVIFTFVPTPSLISGEYDHSYVDDVVETFEKIHQSGQSLQNKIFVIGCTTNPGYTDSVTERLQNFGVSVCYNPEFIAQGDIVNGLRYADMILIGTSSVDASQKVQDIYHKIMNIKPKFNIMSNTAAEITKISINCFLTTKISFANMIGEICNNTGIGGEVSKVLDAIGDDTRIGKKYLNYGFGFGGPCLPRDNRALGKHAEKVGLKINLPLEVDKFNIEHHNYLVDWFTNQYPDKNTNFVFQTVTYKKGTDLLTESQQLNLLHSLLMEGYSCSVVDIPEVLEQLNSDLKPIYGDKLNLFSVGTSVSGVIISL